MVLLALRYNVYKNIDLSKLYTVNLSRVITIAFQIASKTMIVINTDAKFKLFMKWGFHVCRDIVKKVGYKRVRRIAFIVEFV